METQGHLSRLKTLGKRSFSDFVKLNSGKVGSKNALALGSLVGGSVLMELFLSGVAHATCCNHSQWWDGMQCHHSCYTSSCEDVEEFACINFPKSSCNSKSWTDGQFPCP